MGNEEMRKWLLRRIELDALLALEQTAVIQCPFTRNYVFLTLGPKQIYTVQGHCVTLCKLSCFVMFGSLLAFLKVLTSLLWPNANMQQV